MKVIIDISKDIYEHAKGQCEDSNDEWAVMRAIANGVLLSKGYGRLIDASVLKEKLQEHHDFFISAYGSFKDMPIKEKTRVDEISNCIAEVVNAPTIIEAEESEKND